MESYDFSGWATRNNLKCSDGRTILKDAFKHNDGQTVPLVWNHQHNDPLNVLGHAYLKNCPDGVYAYGKFNDTEAGQNAKLLVQHGDVNQLSIYANQLKQQGGSVLHGSIREVSLVLAGANPGAFIDSVIQHGDGSDEEAVIYTGEDISLYHSDDNKKEEKETTEMANEQERTVADVFEEMTDEQKTVVYALIGQALEDAGVADDDDEDYEDYEDDDEGDDDMKHNVFDTDEMQNENVLSHSDMEMIIADGKRYGSLKESFLAHAGDDATVAYGIDNIDYLFPEAVNLNKTPEFIKRDTGWVSKVMSGVHHTPFSRIKSQFADITADAARAKGYIKGNLKKEEVFSLLKRITTPTTIYKKQKLDRDDIVDIKDFDVIAWLKAEMRLMLDEEIARAILIGDGRLGSDEDKINESNIRPIVSDEELFTIQAPVKVAAGATDADKAKTFINTVIKSRKDYKGSGSPTLYTTEDVITDILLLEDQIGHKLYKSVAEVATALRVKEIVTVEVMEGVKGKNGGDLMGIIVNLTDYNVGADKGGAVNMFDDFDIDYNAQKYLIETRCSGALVKPFSAIALELATEGAAG